MIGIIGKKIGMTQIVGPAGDLVPVTVLQAGPVTVTKVLTKSKEGYDAIQVGFEDAKEKQLSRVQIKAFQKNQIKPKRILKEFRFNRVGKASEYKVGQELAAGVFEEGEFVDIQGKTIGKGFQGVIKRWGMKGGPGSHGSMHHRRLGSAGASSFPSRTWPGHHMPGHMGDELKTVQNLLIMRVLKEDNAIVVRGAVPGAKNAILVIRKSFKREKIDLNQLKATPKGGQGKDGAKKTAKKPIRK